MTNKEIILTALRQLPAAILICLCWYFVTVVILLYL